MAINKKDTPPNPLETSPQPVTQETTGRPDSTNSDLSSMANTTKDEVSLTPMEVDNPRENKGVRLHTSPPPCYSPVSKKQRCPKHLDPHAPGESIHPGLKTPSAPQFPPRSSSLGLAKIHTDLTTSKIPRKVSLRTTSPTTEYPSPREYIHSPLSPIKEENEETSSITGALIDALFAYEDGKFGFEDNFEDMPISPETGADDQIHSWLAGSFPSFSKPVGKKDNSKNDAPLLKEGNEKQSTLKHGPSKLSKEVETSDGGSNDADSEHSMAPSHASKVSK